MLNLSSMYFWLYAVRGSYKQHLISVKFNIKNRTNLLIQYNIVVVLMGTVLRSCINNIYKKLIMTSST
jgi:hypothetical protein